MFHLRNQHNTVDRGITKEKIETKRNRKKNILYNLSMNTSKKLSFYKTLYIYIYIILNIQIFLLALKLDFFVMLLFYYVLFLFLLFFIYLSTYMYTYNYYILTRTVTKKKYKQNKLRLHTIISWKIRKELTNQKQPP